MDIQNEIREEGAKGNALMNQANTKITEHQNLMDEIDSIDGDKVESICDATHPQDKLQNAYNNFEAGSGISRQFYPHLMAEVKTPPSFYSKEGKFKLFREEEAPVVITL